MLVEKTSSLEKQQAELQAEWEKQKEDLSTTQVSLEKRRELQQQLEAELEKRREEVEIKQKVLQEEISQQQAEYNLMKEQLEREAAEKEQQAAEKEALLLQKEHEAKMAAEAAAEEAKRVAMEKQALLAVQQEAGLLIAEGRHKTEESVDPNLAENAIIEALKSELNETAAKLNEVEGRYRVVEGELSEAQIMMNDPSTKRKKSKSKSSSSSDVENGGEKKVKKKKSKKKKQVSVVSPRIAENTEPVENNIIDNVDDCDNDSNIANVNDSILNNTLKFDDGDLNFSSPPQERVHGVDPNNPNAFGLNLEPETPNDQYGTPAGPRSTKSKRRKVHREAPKKNMKERLEQAGNSKLMQEAAVIQAAIEGLDPSVKLPNPDENNPSSMEQFGVNSSVDHASRSKIHSALDDSSTLLTSCSGMLSKAASITIGVNSSIGLGRNSSSSSSASSATDAEAYQRHGRRLSTTDYLADQSASAVDSFASPVDLVGKKRENKFAPLPPVPVAMHLNSATDSAVSWSESDRLMLSKHLRANLPRGRSSPDDKQHFRMETVNDQKTTPAALDASMLSEKLDKKRQVNRVLKTQVCVLEQDRQVLYDKWLEAMAQVRKLEEKKSDFAPENLAPPSNHFQDVAATPVNALRTQSFSKTVFGNTPASNRKDFENIRRIIEETKAIIEKKQEDLGSATKAHRADENLASTNSRSIMEDVNAKLNAFAGATNAASSSSSSTNVVPIANPLLEPLTPPDAPMVAPRGGRKPASLTSVTSEKSKDGFGDLAPMMLEQGSLSPTSGLTRDRKDTNILGVDSKVDQATETGTVVDASNNTRSIQLASSSTEGQKKDYSTKVVPTETKLPSLVTETPNAQNPSSSTAKSSAAQTSNDNSNSNAAGAASSSSANAGGLGSILDEFLAEENQNVEDVFLQALTGNSGNAVNSRCSTRCSTRNSSKSIPGVQTVSSRFSSKSNSSVPSKSKSSASSSVPRSMQRFADAKEFSTRQFNVNNTTLDTPVSSFSGLGSYYRLKSSLIGRTDKMVMSTFLGSSGQHVQNNIGTMSHDNTIDNFLLQTRNSQPTRQFDGFKFLNDLAKAPVSTLQRNSPLTVLGGKRSSSKTVRVDSRNLSPVNLTRKTNSISRPKSRPGTSPKNQFRTNSAKGRKRSPQRTATLMSQYDPISMQTKPVRAVLSPKLNGSDLLAINEQSPVTAGVGNRSRNNSFSPEKSARRRANSLPNSVTRLVSGSAASLTRKSPGGRTSFITADDAARAVARAHGAARKAIENVLLQEQLVLPRKRSFHMKEALPASVMMTENRNRSRSRSTSPLNSQKRPASAVDPIRRRPGSASSASKTFWTIVGSPIKTSKTGTASGEKVISLNALPLLKADSAASKQKSCVTSQNIEDSTMMGENKATTSSKEFFEEASEWQVLVMPKDASSTTNAVPVLESASAENGTKFSTPVNAKSSKTETAEKPKASAAIPTTTVTVLLPPVAATPPTGAKQTGSKGPSSSTKPPPNLVAHASVMSASSTGGTDFESKGGNSPTKMRNSPVKPAGGHRKSSNTNHVAHSSSSKNESHHTSSANAGSKPPLTNRTEQTDMSQAEEDLFLASLHG